MKMMLPFQKTLHMLSHWYYYCCWCLPFLLCIHSKSQEALPFDQHSVNVNLNKLRNYEIVYPVEIQQTHNATNNSKHFQIPAFGENYDVFIEDITKGSQMTSDKFMIEYLNSNNSYQGKYYNKDSCLYSGPSSTNSSLKVVLNYCNGLEGIIESDSHTIFIEPIRENDSMEAIHRKHLVYRSNDVIHEKMKWDFGEKETIDDPRLSSNHRQRRSGYQSYLMLINKSGRKVQIYYYDSHRSMVPFIHLLPNERRGINTFENTEWVAKDDKTNALFHLNNRDRYISTKNTPDKRVKTYITIPTGTVFERAAETNEVEGDDYHVEVLVVADKSMMDYHGKQNLEKYLITMMRISDDIFKHKSLGAKLHVNIAKIICLETDDIGFSVYADEPSRTLRSASDFTASLKNQEEGHPDHFDVAIAITKKEFGPSGYAQLYSVCTPRRSCAIVYDEGLTSAFIVAHEIAHLLGLEHDGEDEASRCKSDGPRGSVMSPLIVARYDRFHWSSCSREVMRANLEYFQCLLNDPKDQQQQSTDISNRLPGSFYTIDEQCQLTFGRASTACTTFGFDPCQRLWCSSTSRRCITQRSPALDGTVCGKNRYCYKSRCIEQDNWTKIKKVIVNGDWSQWSTWTACSQTCGIGVRYRDRICDNPKPGPGGKPCSGKGHEIDICSTEPCPLSKSYLGLMQEHCRNMVDRNRKDWTLYFDADFAIRLRQPRNNLNCTFEDGFCNWKQDTLKNDHNWVLQSGKTQSINTGPIYDHTYGNRQGKYIYMEASSTHKSAKYAGDVARLISRVVQVPRICFSMYYHMYGKDMGSLRVNIRFVNGTEFNKWNISGNQGNYWKQAKITMEMTEDFQIIIEAIRGEHWAGDIAVDDIRVYTGVCPMDIKRQNPCKVSCRSRNARSFMMNKNVRDGVLCNPDPRSSNICLDGKCLGFGCDNRFGSGLHLDNCGICGGNGSSCVRKRGVDNIPVYGGEYKVLLRLSKGSTFFNFTENESQAQLYGIRKAGRTTVDLSYRREDYFSVDDKTFHFMKDNMGRQRIRTNGPIKEDVDIIVYANTRSTIQFQYEFYEKNSKQYTYLWQLVGWETCSQTCGSGKQKSITRCIRQEDGARMYNSFCKEIKQPSYMRVCKTKPCPSQFIWISKKWSDCSRSCGAGFQIRKVTCTRAQDNAPAPLSRCKDKKMPETTRKCNIQKCPKNHVWKAHEWTQCSSTCGLGLKTRIITCIEEDTKLIVSDDKCKGKKPDLVGPCNLHPCETFMWKITEEGMACSKTCGGGIRIVISNCVKEKDHSIIVDGRYCDGPKPPHFKTCNTYVCPEYVWDIGKESTCSVSCGDGFKTRTMKCIDKGTGVHINDKYCKQKKPDVKIPCNIRRCAGYKIEYSAWKDCNVMCGKGVQYRKPFCIKDDYTKVVSSELCGKKVLEKEQRVCEKPACAKPEDLKCSFTNNNFCQWQNAQNGDFEWSVGRVTPSLSTGPDYDHTTRNGRFAYIEASRPRQYGDRAMLVSPIVRADKGCLVFWYHMKGSTVGRLRLYLSTNQANKILFEKKGHQSKNWLLGRVDVNSTAGTSAGYRFMFEGIRDVGAYGDIALDDLSFFDKPCNQLDVIHNPIVEQCREISPLCKQEDRKKIERNCKRFDQFRLLCCSSCVKFLSF